MNQLANQVAVVTGAGRGIGQAIALKLAAAGADIACVDLKLEFCEETVQKAQALGRKAWAFAANVSEAASVTTAVEQILAATGKVDILVNNAGILISEEITACPAEKWRAVMNVNLFGYFLTTKHACRVMKGKGGGSIININSKSGKKGSAANSAYAASKFGGIGHTQSVALEMAPYSIRCNAICPGNLLDSPLWTHPEKGLFVQYLRAGKIHGANTIEDVRRAYISQVPMKRGCTYEDVCNAVLFLASDQSAYITGIALSVSGGQEMN